MLRYPWFVFLAPFSFSPSLSLPLFLSSLLASFKAHLSSLRNHQTILLSHKEKRRNHMDKKSLLPLPLMWSLPNFPLI